MADTLRVRLLVSSQRDAERAEHAARDMAREVGLNTQDAEAVALATRELATNLVRYGDAGEMTLGSIDGPAGAGIEVASRDAGPGIADVAQAMTDGFSTGGGLGGGLPSVRRLMYHFEITSTGSGTQVVARKWPRRR